ncbi:hypothetical protein [Nocardiopsis sp. NRRL B-16309]|uniref:hypothetical protein n=1 Tax=Nocardiopsis sp. NRRL B-16309 TaxID=1519494 RepID=UPI0006B041E6|nr:hypothetical protein [Nocardiopsis sp. NRRL B-16309]KOX10180.1 hypothetical protein ADL05_26265 [Nocardiopsis sp. NRRL B-16309]
MNSAHRYLSELADQVSDWDVALIRQAVLVFARLNDGRVSANDFRDYLPPTSQGAVGLVIRQLPCKKHGQLIRKARAVPGGWSITEPSTAESTHGKPIQVWELTPAGWDAARQLMGDKAVA